MVATLEAQETADDLLGISAASKTHRIWLYAQLRSIISGKRPYELHNHTRVEAKWNLPLLYRTLRVWEQTVCALIYRNVCISNKSNSVCIGFSDFQRTLRFSSKLAERVVELRKKTDIWSVLSFLWLRYTLTRKKNLGTICKVISSFYRVVGSGWLVEFSHFQKNLRFGSNLADSVVELRKKADFLNILSFIFCGL